MSERTKVKRPGPVEVLIVVFLCVFALAAIAPAVLRSRADAYRMQCVRNLSRIGEAMLIYADDYEGVCPRAGGRHGMWDRDIPDWKATNRFAAYGMSRNDQGGRASISSCFYLLVKYAGVLPKSFVCPGDIGTREFNLADTGAGDREMIDLWDFGPEAYKRCSYSYHMPFGWFPPTKLSDPRMALAADRSPWMDSPAGKAKDTSLFAPEGARAAVKVGNALAHKEEGQNVLFVDGHVSFEDEPYCALNEDNIYTFWDGGDVRQGRVLPYGGYSMHKGDSYLVHDPQEPKVTVTAKHPRILNSADLPKTAVVATLDSPLPEHKNAIWSSAFHMAWDKLSKDVIGAPIEVVGADDFVTRLNQTQLDPTNLDAESIYAMAGTMKSGIVEEIQKEMARRFPSQPEPVFDERDTRSSESDDETVVVYSHLNMDVEFEHPFFSDNDALAFRGSQRPRTSVAAFCTRILAYGTDPARGQVEVLYYKKSASSGLPEFAVELRSLQRQHQIVLALTSRKDTLGETIAAVEREADEFKQNPKYQTLRKLQPAGVTFADSLTVPYILFDLTHSFAELRDRKLKNRQWAGHQILEATNTVNFAFSKTAVELKWQAGPFFVPFRNIPKPRVFSFDRPFLIYVKKRGAEFLPFFVM